MTCCNYDDPARLTNVTSKYLILKGNELQAYRYFDEYKSYIKEFFTCDHDLMSRVHEKAHKLFNNDLSHKLCMHVRRGDFRGTGFLESQENFVLPSIDYVTKYLKEKQLAINVSVAFIGDDLAFMKNISNKLNITSFIREDMTRGEDLCFGIHYCDSLIISAAGSTFAWWIGYLKKSDGPVFYNSQITKPSDDFNLYMSKKIFDYDGYPKEWIRLALNNNSIVVDNKWFYEKFGSKINISLIPYIGQLKEPIKPGQTLIVQGLTIHESRRFTINLHNTFDDYSGNDIPLHISVRFDGDNIVFNTFSSGQWGKEERKNNPFFPGDSFDIRIRAHDHKFDIFIDRKPFFEFFYRLPLNEITHFSVAGDCFLSEIHWSDSKYYTIPLETSIPGGFTPGKRLLIFGQVEENAMSFNISLLHKSGDVALHFNLRFDEKMLVINALTHGTWSREEREGKNLFEKGALFDFFIDNTEDSFKIIINNHYYADFSHRTGTHEIHGLRIQGPPLIRLDDFETSTNCIDGVETVLFFRVNELSNVVFSKFIAHNKIHKM